MTRTGVVSPDDDPAEPGGLSSSTKSLDEKDW